MKRIGPVPHIAPRRSLGTTVGFSGPERLVGLGFRYWLAGYRTGDISSWEKAWDTYSSAMGAAAAHALDLAGTGSVHHIDLQQFQHRLRENLETTRS